MKHRSLRSINVPQDCNWCYRKLLKVRPIAWDLTEQIVDDGTSIYLWWKFWHPSGPLLKVYNRRFMYDTGLPLHAKLSFVIENGV